MIADSKSSIDNNSWKLTSVAGYSDEDLRKFCLLIEDVEAIESCTILKSTPDKKVILVNDSQSDPIVIKNQHYLGFGHRLQATLRYLFGGKHNSTYTVREFNNCVMAGKRGVPVSRILGYGCKIEKGLVRQEVLISTGCPDALPLIHALKAQAGQSKEIEKTLQRAFQLISSMLRAGYVHLDLHSDNILISGSGPKNDTTIDHEFGSLFDTTKLLEVSAFVFGYLFRCQVREVINLEQYTNLVQKTVQSIVGTHQQLHTDFNDWFTYAATTRVAKKERRKYLHLR
jgi:tRNA A-37 threonylcarbamoyl transferase component Bud32